jgi:integrase
LNEAAEANIQTNPQYKSRKFSVTSEQTAAIYLNEAELKELEQIDLSADPRLERVRDLFLIGCYTGLRFGDWYKVTPAQIQGGNIVIAQAKTGATIAIPVHKTVEKILARYGGQLPRAITNQKANEYLKEVGKKMDSLKINTSKTITKGGAKITTITEKWEVLSTHTARRSFSSNEFLAGTPAITIMAITGHKTESSFLRYIKLTPTEHAKLMKLQWEKRALLRAV